MCFKRWLALILRKCIYVVKFELNKIKNTESNLNNDKKYFAVSKISVKLHTIFIITKEMNKKTHIS